MKPKIFPLGDGALTVEFGNEISAELSDAVLRLDDYLNRNPFVGLIETIPAYASLTCFYDVQAVRKSFPNRLTAFEPVKVFIENAFKETENLTRKESRLINIPVSFDKKYALDLEEIARFHNLSPEKVIEIFLSKTYRVYLLGFLPGFSYMGEVDERIAAPRKNSPRLLVPKGSVGIAGKQTGIYSLDSPGGWQIIGKTNVELFTPHSENPTFLQAGDTIKFHFQE